MTSPAWTRHPADFSAIETLAVPENGSHATPGSRPSASRVSRMNGMSFVLLPRYRTRQDTDR